MRVDFRDEHRLPLGRAEIDIGKQTASVRVTSSAGTVERALHWDRAVDEKGQLRRCIACGCRELFVRKDFPQKIGLGLVIVAALVSVGLFATNHVAASFGVLFLAVIIDWLINFFTGRCVVCYRCRTEYRNLDISPEIGPWDLAIGEKYRPVRLDDESESATSSSASSSQTGSSS